MAASGIDGEFESTPADAGTKTTWRWTVHPRSALTRPVVTMLGKAWDGWARLALAELSNQLVR
jgi:hypothetical protein